METALRASKELLGGILETAAEAIISMDEAQHITMFNQGTERIFAYSAKELVGKPLGKGIQPSEIFDVKSLGLLGMRERALGFWWRAADQRRSGTGDTRKTEDANRVKELENKLID